MFQGKHDRIFFFGTPSITDVGSLFHPLCPAPSTYLSTLDS